MAPPPPTLPEAVPTASLSKAKQTKESRPSPRPDMAASFKATRPRQEAMALGVSDDDDEDGSSWGDENSDEGSDEDTANGTVAVVQQHAAASASTNPWNAFLHEHGGRGHSRAELSSMYAAGGGTSSYPARDASSSHSASRGGSSSCSGSACYSVSSNPSGPMKADGTPDMRYASNRR